MDVGDFVTWTIVRRRGRTIRMKRMEGEIIAIDEMVATVKHGKKAKAQVPIGSLRNANEEGELTQFVKLMAKANRE